MSGAGPTERRLLAPAEVVAAVGRLPGWAERDGRLVRSLRFADFSAAFAFLTRVALQAERLNHHPDWSNSYNRVQIALVTHDLGGISTLDIALAEAINALAEAEGGA